MDETAHRTPEAALTRWIERNVGGRVVRVWRLARWRPAWDVDVERDGVPLPLHARGERERNFAIPYRIADEAPTHRLREAAGLPVPHVHGLCDEPYTLVMDRLPGLVDLSFAGSDAERDGLIDEYLAMLPRIYAIDLADAARAGFEVPTDAHGVALGSFARFERCYDALATTADPVIVFLRRWLHRNYPRDRAQPAFVTYDAFQFMFEGGRITGLLDFELAHVGDPLMDLAALRVRDTIKSLGDLSAIADRYEQVTGIAVDHDAVDYHAVLYNACTVLSAAPPLSAPLATTDVVSHMAWYVNSARWAFEIIADILGIELEPVAPLRPARTRHRPAVAHLAGGLRELAREDGADYQRTSLSRLARHLLRVEEVGRDAEAADLDDLAHLLGRRPVADRTGSPAPPGAPGVAGGTTGPTGPTEAVDAADRELIAFIEAAGPEHDEALVRLLDRRMRRAHLLMAPEGSLMLRHPRLRGLRPGSVDPTSDDERWPAGSIPGTA